MVEQGLCHVGHTWEPQPSCWTHCHSCLTGPKAQQLLDQRLPGQWITGAQTLELVSS